MAYHINRLTRGGGFSPRQIVERIGSETRKDAARRAARVAAVEHPGDWIQVSMGNSGAILVTYQSRG